MPDAPEIGEFRDEVGHVFRPVVTDAVARTAGRVGLDLGRLVELPADEFARALFVPDRLGRLLYLACEPRVRAEGLSPEAFARLVCRPGTLEAAAAALTLALVAWAPLSRLAAEIGPGLVLALSVTRFFAEVTSWPV